jgi:hypothetical protein
MLHVSYSSILCVNYFIGGGQLITNILDVGIALIVLLKLLKNTYSNIKSFR